MKLLSKVIIYLKNIIVFYKIKSIEILIRNIIFWFENNFYKGKLKLINLYNFKILIPLGVEGIGRALYVYKGRELDHKWILEKVLNNDDVIFDLGANIGYYSLLENYILNGNCKIYAIEPDPRNIKVLAENIKFHKLENKITFEQGAISNFSGNADLIFSERTNLNRLTFDNEVDNSNTIKVPVFDFGKYIKKLPNINVIRMDIEGGEINIFESLINFSTKNSKSSLPKRIVFETHNYGENGSKMKILLEKVIKIGYKVEYLCSDDEHKKSPIIKSYGYIPIKTFNEHECSRGIYSNVSNHDAVKLISNWKGTRTVCLFLK